MGSGAKTPSALAPFAHNWIGGDIHGLSAYAGTLYGYVPEINDVSTALDGVVKKTVGDAGWQGTASSAFTTAWEHDAEGATALATVTTSTGGIVDWLAVQLSTIEHALEQAADQASSNGVPIGADGQPPNACLANPTAEKWRVYYQGFYNECMLDAVTSRNKAAAGLQAIGDAILGKHDPGDKGLSEADLTAVSDVLGGFLNLQTRYRGFVDLQVGHAKSDLASAKTTAIEDARQANGRFGTWSPEDRQAFTDAKGTLEGAESDLSAAKANENWFTKVTGFSASDIPKVGDSVEGIDGVAGDLARAGAGIPFVDIAAAGVGTYFSAKEDMAAGIPGYVAIPGEAAGNIAAIGLGTAAGIGATGLAATALGGLGATGLALSVGAGGAGVLAGGVVAYGVGDFAHNLINENWSADIHQHGVALGVLDGVGDSAVKTGKDIAHVGESIWHGISSIF